MKRNFRITLFRKGDRTIVKKKIARGVVARDRCLNEIEIYQNNLRFPSEYDIDVEESDMDFSPWDRKWMNELDQPL